MIDADRATWKTTIALAQAPLLAGLADLRARHAPHALVIVTRSRDVTMRLERDLPFPTQVIELSEFLGLVSGNEKRRGDRLPDAVIEWAIKDAAPASGGDRAQDTFTKEARRVIHVLEANGVRPPYVAGEEAFSSIESAHRALLDALAPHNAHGRWATHQIVSDVPNAPSRLLARYPGLACVALYELNSLSPAEKSALDHVLAPVDDVVAFLRARTPGARDHAALAHADDAVSWLAARGRIEVAAAEGARAASLASLFALALAPRGTLDDVHILACPDVDAEVEEVAQRVHALLASGVPSHKIGIVAPRLERYANLLRERFEEDGVPYSLSYMGALHATAPGALIRAILEDLDADHERDTFIDLLRQPLMRAALTILATGDGAAERLDPSRLAKLLAARGSTPRGVGGKRGWHAILDRLAAPLKDEEPGPESEWHARQCAAARHLVDALEHVRDADTAAAFFERLRGFLGAHGLSRSLRSAMRASRAPDAVRAAYSALAELLAEVEDAFDVAGRLDSPASEARRVLRRTLAQADAPAFGDPEWGVQILALRGAGAATFDHVILMGAVHDALPAAVRRPGALRGIETRLGRTLDIMDPDAEARHVFHALLTNTAGRVIITHPASDEGVPVTRSVLLDELEDAYGLAPVPEVAHAHRSLRAAARAAGDGGHDYADAPPHVEGARALVDERASSALPSAYGGRVTAESARAALASEALAARDSVSPTRLESYAQCAHRYFYRYGLGIKAPITRDDGVDALLKGNLVHEILEAYADEGLTRSGGAFAIGNVDPGDAEAVLLEIAEGVLSEARFPGIHWDVLEEMLLGGLADGPYAHAPPGLFKRFLAYERATHANDVLLDVEVAFGTEGRPRVTIDTPRGSVAVTGYIDRVDAVASPRGRAVRVIDYKTGTTRRADEAHAGISFQMPIYLRAAAVLYPDATADSAAYYQLKRPRAKEVGIARASRLDRAADPEAFDRLVDVDTPRRVGEMLEAEAAGHYGLTILDSKDAPCRFCDYRRICGIRAHETGERRARVLDHESEGPAVTGYIPDLVRAPAPDSGGEDA